MGLSVLRSVDRAHPLPKGGKLCSLRHHRTCPLRPPRCGTNMTTTEHRELAQILPPSLEGPPSANSSPERWRSGPRGTKLPACRVSWGCVTETARVPLTSFGAGQQRNRGGQEVLPTTTDPAAFHERDRLRPTSTSANSISANFWMLNFGTTKCGALKGGAPKGGGPNLEKVGPRRVEPRREPRRVGGPNFRSFFPSSATIFFILLSLGVLSWNFVGV